jgi:hypothetical protein
MLDKTPQIAVSKLWQLHKVYEKSFIVPTEALNNIKPEL